MALRIAVQLSHTRRDPDMQGIQIKRSGSECSLHPSGWMLTYLGRSVCLLEEEDGLSKTPWSRSCSCADITSQAAAACKGKGTARQSLFYSAEPFKR